MRMRSVLVPVVLAAALLGCDSEDQPNKPVDPTQVDAAELAKKTADMMKNANTGMDPSKLPAKGGGSAPPGMPGRK